MIKLYAFIYRKTGWYSPWARAAEYKHIMATLPNIILDHQTVTEDAVTLILTIRLEAGMWQSKHGFTRTHKQAWRGK